jgi:hypothetical protein
MINEVINEIRNLSYAINQRQCSYEMRRRYNPHHPDEVVEHERNRFLKIQREEFFKLKDLYVKNREEIFTQELDESFRELCLALDKCVNDDLEREFRLYE